MKEVWKREMGNKEMNKRAQLTIFIILGIMFVAAIAAFLAFRNGLGDIGIIRENINPDIKPINEFVTDCVRQTGNDAIYQIGKTGGYVIPPEPKLEFVNLTHEGIAYYLYGGENKIPSEEKIQDELSKYMNSFIYFCVSDFPDFPNFNITQGEAKTKTRIESGKVIFDVNYPLRISKENKVYSIKKFSVEIPVRLNETYWVINEIMNEQMKKKDAVCLTCLYEISQKNNMKVDMLESGDKDIVFLVIDNRSKIKNYDYQFYFANRYE